MVQTVTANHPLAAGWIAARTGEPRLNDSLHRKIKARTTQAGLELYLEADERVAFIPDALPLAGLLGEDWAELLTRFPGYPLPASWSDPPSLGDLIAVTPRDGGFMNVKFHPLCADAIEAHLEKAHRLAPFYDAAKHASWVFWRRLPMEYGFGARTHLEYALIALKQEPRMIALGDGVCVSSDEILRDLRVEPRRHSVHVREDAIDALYAHLLAHGMINPLAAKSGYLSPEEIAHRLDMTPALLRPMLRDMGHLDVLGTLGIPTVAAFAKRACATGTELSAFDLMVDAQGRLPLQCLARRAQGGGYVYHPCIVDVLSSVLNLLPVYDPADARMRHWVPLRRPDVANDAILAVPDIFVLPPYRLHIGEAALYRTVTQWLEEDRPLPIGEGVRASEAVLRMKRVNTGQAGYYVHRSALRCLYDEVVERRGLNLDDPLYAERGYASRSAVYDRLRRQDWFLDLLDSGEAGFIPLCQQLWDGISGFTARLHQATRGGMVTAVSERHPAMQEWEFALGDFVWGHVAQGPRALFMTRIVEDFMASCLREGVKLEEIRFLSAARGTDAPSGAVRSH